MHVPPQPAGPAALAGSFSWSADLKCCISGRHFTTNATRDIWITVGSVSPCTVPEVAGRVTYLITLWRDDRLDNQVGGTRKVQACSAKVVWRGVGSGTYYMRLEVVYPWRDQTTYHFNGGVYYDGSTP